MENFIKNQKKKLVLYRIVYITMIIVAIGSFALNQFGILISARGGNDTPLVAPCIGGAIAMIFQAVNIKKALKDEKKMKALWRFALPMVGFRLRKHQFMVFSTLKMTRGSSALRKFLTCKTIMYFRTIKEPSLLVKQSDSAF